MLARIQSFFIKGATELLILVASLTQAAPLSALPTAPFGIELENTRVRVTSSSRVAFLRIKNTANSPFFYTTGIEESPLEHSQPPSFIVSPASGVVAPHRALHLRIVRTNTPLPDSTETLASLSLRIVPASSASTKHSSLSHLQSLMHLHVKVFYRPDRVATTTNNTKAVSQLRAHCSGSTLVIENPAPIYLTLVTIQADNNPLTHVVSEHKPSPVLPPFSALAFPLAACPRSLSVTTLDELGVPRLVRTFAPEALKP